MKHTGLFQKLLSLRPSGRGAGEPWDALEPSEQSVADMLSWYAGGPLAPDPRSLSRARSAILTTAAAAAASGPAGRSVRSRTGARQFAGSFHPRLLAAAAVTAVLASASFGLVAAESGPGQPFYRVRLDVEAMNLPPAGSSARIDADLKRADARLDEIAAEVSRRDWNAAADAANAYASVISPMWTPQDDKGLAKFKKNLERQLARLEQLRGQVSGPATGALDNAIARLQALLNGTGPGNDNGNGPGDGNNGNNGQGNNGNNGQGNNGQGNGPPGAGELPSPAQNHPTPEPTPRAHPTPPPK